MSLKSASPCVPSGGDVYFNCGKNSTPAKCCSGSPSNVGGKMVCPGVSSGLCASNGGNPCVKEGGDVYYDCCRGGIDGKPVACCNGYPPKPDSSGALRCQPTPPPQPIVNCCQKCGNPSSCSTGNCTPCTSNFCNGTNCGSSPPPPSPSTCPYVLYKKYTDKNSYVNNWKNYGKMDSDGFTDYTDSFDFISDNFANKTTRFFINSLNSPNGTRKSHRIKTEEGFSGSAFNYKNTLVVADILHMPEGCGTWPAFWIIGRNLDGKTDDWPNNGEIDIIESVNSIDSNSSTNVSTLHSYTNPRVYSFSPTAPECYTQIQYNCNASDGKCMDGDGGETNCCIGCLPDNVTWNNKSFGFGFNNNQGGVYAFEFDKTGAFSIWFWSRKDGIPTNEGGPLSQNPNPKTWEKNLAAFWTIGDVNGAKIPMKNLFKDGFDIILNTKLCGSFVDSDWDNSNCSYGNNPDCMDYFARNPDVSKVFWEIASIQVFNETPNNLISSKQNYDPTQTQLTTCSDSKPIKWYVVLIAVLAFILLWLVVSYFMKNTSSDPVKLGMGFMFGHDDSSW